VSDSEQLWDLSFGLPPFGRVPGFGLRILEGMGHGAWSMGKYSGQRAASSRQYRYSLFARSVDMSCLDDFYGFYDLNGLNGLNDLNGFNYLTNPLFLYLT
jgi:hypothetical protein